MTAREDSKAVLQLLVFTQLGVQVVQTHWELVVGWLMLMQLDKQVLWEEVEEEALVLQEEAVLLALRGQAEDGFWVEREKVYEVADPEVRNREFHRLHRRRFEELDLGRPLCEALLDEPLIAEKVGRCRVSPAVSPREEGADLLVPQDPARLPVLFLRVRPSMFSRGEELLAEEGGRALGQS